MRLTMVSEIMFFLFTLNKNRASEKGSQRNSPFGETKFAAAYRLSPLLRYALVAPLFWLKSEAVAILLPFILSFSYKR